MMGEIIITEIDTEIMECPEEKSNKEWNLMLELFTEEPKSEEMNSTQNATHRHFVHISGGERYYLKNKINPLDLNKKQEMKTKKAEKQKKKKGGCLTSLKRILYRNPKNVVCPH